MSNRVNRAIVVIGPPQKLIDALREVADELEKQARSGVSGIVEDSFYVQWNANEALEVELRFTTDGVESQDDPIFLEVE